MSLAGTLLFFYSAFAVAAAVGSPMVMNEIAPDDLGTEGRVVLGIAAALLWPVFALWGLSWVLRALGRGVGQCFRLVVPAKPKIPRAEVRR